MLLQTASQGLVPSAQVVLSILPIVAVSVCSVLLFFYLLWEHKRSRLYIEKGMKPEPRGWEEKLLLIGIVSLFVGAGLFFFFLLYNGLDESLLGGIIPTMVGLGIVTYYRIILRRNQRSSDRNG